MQPTFNFPPKSEREKRDLLAYIQAAPLADDYWHYLKALYKKLEQQHDAELLVALIYKVDKQDPKKLTDRFPTQKTLAYMKRRMARFLLNLSQQNCELFLKIAKELLLQQTSNINFAHQWVCARLLYGASKRWEQTRHGRGKYIAKESISNIYRREEAASEVWDQFPSIAYVLLDVPNLAPEVYEFALKLLVRNKRSTPSFSRDQVECFFNSSSPWLRHFGVVQSCEWIEQGILTNEGLQARAFFYAPADLKRKILTHVNNRIQEKPSQGILEKVKQFFDEDQKSKYDLTKFINTLADLTFQNLENRDYENRRIKYSIRVIDQMMEQLSEWPVKNHAGVLMKKDQPLLERIVFHFINRSSVYVAADWLTAVGQVSEINRQRIFKIYNEKLDQLRDFNKRELIMNWLEHKEFAVADFGWRMVSEWAGHRGSLAQRFASRNFWYGWSRTAFRNAVISDTGAKLLWQNCESNFKSLSDIETYYHLAKEGAKSIRQPLMEFITSRASRQLFMWLNVISKFTEERDVLIERIERKIKPNQSYHPSTAILPLIHSDKWVQKTAWRIFARQMNKPKIIHQVVWQAVYRSNKEWSIFLNNLFQIEDPGFRNNAQTVLSNLINQNPSLLQKVISVIDVVYDNIDIKTLFAILKVVNDRNWSQIRPIILRSLKNEKANLLWLNILKSIPTLENDTLSHRLIADQEIRTTLLNVDSTEVMDCHYPPLENLILDWAIAHKDLFKANSQDLLRLCTHPLPKIRKWGILKAQKTTLNLAFSLQLLESGVPDAMQLGQEFFEHAPAGSSQELDNLLALIDSPDRHARTLGRDYFHARKDHLNTPTALDCLTEHTDPMIQEFLAENLNGQTPRKTITIFDRSVLRTKNKARRAKELVKNRVEKNLKIAPKTLLELARGQNKKDKEWAIAQLVKLSLSGADIPEFSLK